jgi:prepilin-type N-terminal cleavage/methylation domain-containing protein
MSNKKEKGFTLIELLVVIAIIGILASVVLASLNSARSRGSDAAIKANLSNIRAQAALYFDTNNVYGNSVACRVQAGGTATGCTGVFSAASAGGAQEGLRAAAAASGSDTYAYTNAAGDSWFVTVNLKQTGPTAYYCVDSTGAGKTVTGTLTTTPWFTASAVCP